MVLTVSSQNHKNPENCLTSIGKLMYNRYAYLNLANIFHLWNVYIKKQ